MNVTRIAVVVSPPDASNFGAVTWGGQRREVQFSPLLWPTPPAVADRVLVVPAGNGWAAISKLGGGAV